MPFGLTEYLRHNQAFRRVFQAPLKWRSQLLRSKTDRLRQQLRTVVKGGEVVLSPRNLSGDFVMPATSHVAHRILLDGTYEEEITALLQTLRWVDGDVVNIGANVGLYTVFFARTFENAGVIWAIEPNPEALRFLHRNVAVNGGGHRIEVIEGLVSAELMEVQFETVPGKPEYSSINGIVHPSLEGEPRSTTTVLGKPLDSLLPGEAVPRLMFIDTEGAELLVFRGAERVLRAHRPIVVFECEHRLLAKFGHSSQGVEGFLKDLGYVVWNALAIGQPLQHPFNGEAIALPTERHEQITERIKAGRAAMRADTGPTGAT